MVETYLFNNDHSVAEADTTVVAITVCAFVLVADEHLLTVIPRRDVNSWTAEGWQNAVEQVLADSFCQCCHVSRFLFVVFVLFSVRVAAALRKQLTLCFLNHLA